MAPPLPSLRSALQQLEDFTPEHFDLLLRLSDDDVPKTASDEQLQRVDWAHRPPTGADWRRNGRAGGPPGCRLQQLPPRRHLTSPTSAARTTRQRVGAGPGAVCISGKCVRWRAGE